MKKKETTSDGAKNLKEPQYHVEDSLEKKMLLEAEKVALQLERDELNRVSKLLPGSKGKRFSRSHLETLTEIVNLLDEQRQLAKEITQHAHHLLNVNKKLYCQPGSGTLKNAKNPRLEAERQLSNGINALKGISYNLQVAGASAVNIGSKIVEISKELKDERIRLLEKKKQIDELRNSLETNLEYFEPEQEKLNKESYSEISAEISDETLNISLNCVKDNTVEDNQRREEEDQIEQKEQENI